MKTSDLFFKYIKDKHLERKGVTAHDLFESLKAQGFVETSGPDSFEWTEKAKSQEFKREFWKCIDTAKGDSNV